MNIDTGEIARFKSMIGVDLAQGQDMTGFIQVPDDLSDEAEKALAGQDRVVVDLAADTPLSRWANTERQARKTRATAAKRTDIRRKAMRKASKKQNRR